MLGRDGGRIVVNYRQDAEAAQAVAAEITAAGGEALTLQADVTDPEAITAAYKQIEAAWGGVDQLVANAGINLAMPIPLMSPEAWRNVLATNLDSAFYLTKAVSRGMVRRRSGRIVYRDRHDRRAPRGQARAPVRRHPHGTLRTSRRGRGRCPLSAFRCRRLHHRPGALR
jgi:hypothetical protein